jgi:uncharacterized protein
MMTTAIARLCLVAALTGATGCFSLGRNSPALEQYVLSSARTAEAPPPPGPAGVLLGMRRPGVAAYLATPSIVVRQGAHGIGTSDFHRWGEELGQGISRAIASHLTAAPSIRAVNIAPWPARTEHAYLLQFDVARFEGVIDSVGAVGSGAAHVAASWELVRPADGAVLARGSTDWWQPGWRIGDYAALVAMLEEGLGGVARDVLACVQRLGATAQSAEPPLTCGG